MGLDSKIITVLYTTSNANYATELCVEIAENFAIGFAEWLVSSSILKTEIPMNVKLKMYKNQKKL